MWGKEFNVRHLIIMLSLGIKGSRQFLHYTSERWGHYDWPVLKPITGFNPALCNGQCALLWNLQLLSQFVRSCRFNAKISDLINDFLFMCDNILILLCPYVYLFTSAIYCCNLVLVVWGELHFHKFRNFPFLRFRKLQYYVSAIYLQINSV